MAHDDVVPTGQTAADAAVGDLLPAITLRPLPLMWQVRFPLIAFPVMSGLRCLAGATDDGAHTVSPRLAFESELALILAITAGTGLLQLPFSVAWWFLLMASFVLEAPLILGVSTVLAATLILGWYGAALRHPHVISAFWSCRLAKAAETVGLCSVAEGMAMPLGVWGAWDLAVHALPAVLMLAWHGPSFGILADFRSGGAVTTAAVVVALPLGMMWLWGVSLGRGRVPWGARLRDANDVYQIFPALPDTCWRWVFGSHGAVCALWLAFLTLSVPLAGYAAVLPLSCLCLLGARAFLREDLLLDRAMVFLILHLLAAWGFYYTMTHPHKWRIVAEVVALTQLGGLGITCGYHRLWSHRAYVAETPLRVVLMLLASFSNQGTIYHWARDHRAHHKWTDTPADPHDTRRGFFYAHMGWLLVPKTEELKRKGKEIPCGDLLADPVVAFQKWAEDRFLFMELMSFGLPTVFGHLVWKDAWLGFLVHGVTRWLFTLHGTWCVNSVAHYFGDRRYDPQASAGESWFTSLATTGEGWHSYHHKYPWDYAASEFGVHRQWNPSKLFIDLAACLGQAHHLKRSHLSAVTAATKRS